MAHNHYSLPVDTGSNHAQAAGISEHTVVRVMAGEPEDLRGRLADALERLGFRVLSENPLRGKHGPLGAAASYFSANALDYPTSVEILLKPQGLGATRVTIDYAVLHGGFGKGDRQSLTRQAEAIIALAAQQAQTTICLQCNADVVADSKFCRKCGAPTSAAAQPAELEVMRLTANARAGHQWTLIGAAMLGLGTFLPLMLWMLVHFADLSKQGKAVSVVAGLFAIFGLWGFLAGLWRTHVTLNPREFIESTLPAPPRRVALSAPRTNELEPPHPQLSITEGTTSLLNEAVPPAHKPEPVPQARGTIND
jgi:ribosomal protein L40E